VWRLRKAWLHAQKIHDEEHETHQPLSLSCEAVGHHWYETLGGVLGPSHVAIDNYDDYFDADAQRHFLREYREVNL
jgi:hypothetical protein